MLVGCERTDEDKSDDFDRLKIVKTGVNVIEDIYTYTDDMFDLKISVFSMYNENTFSFKCEVINKTDTPFKFSFTSLSVNDFMLEPPVLMNADCEKDEPISEVCTVEYDALKDRGFDISDMSKLSFTFKVDFGDSQIFSDIIEVDLNKDGLKSFSDIIDSIKKDDDIHIWDYEEDNFIVYFEEQNKNSTDFKFLIYNKKDYFSVYSFDVERINGKLYDALDVITCELYPNSYAEIICELPDDIFEQLNGNIKFQETSVLGVVMKFEGGEASNPVLSLNTFMNERTFIDGVLEVGSLYMPLYD